MSFDINYNPEEVHGKVVAHKVKKSMITITVASDHHDVDFGLFTKSTSNELDKYGLIQN